MLPGALPPFANAVAPASNTASAPAAVTPKAGDVVYDKTGAQAGSVEGVNGNVVVVATEQGKGSKLRSAPPVPRRPRHRRRRLRMPLFSCLSAPSP